MTEEPHSEPQNLRLLRRLVTLLTGIMIFGVLGILALLALRLTQPSADTSTLPLALPETLALPDGETALSVTYGPGWYLVVTASERIFVFDATTGDLIQNVGLLGN